MQHLAQLDSNPGFVEADTVTHYGNSLECNFVWTHTMTDIVTGWTEWRGAGLRAPGALSSRSRSSNHYCHFLCEDLTVTTGANF